MGTFEYPEEVVYARVESARKRDVRFAELEAQNADLLAALRALRGWCIPGMNWTDSVGQELLKMADEALAKASTEDAR